MKKMGANDSIKKILVKFGIIVSFVGGISLISNKYFKSDYATLPTIGEPSQEITMPSIQPWITLYSDKEGKLEKVLVKYIGAQQARFGFIRDPNQEEIDWYNKHKGIVYYRRTCNKCHEY